MTTKGKFGEPWSTYSAYSGEALPKSINMANGNPVCGPAWLDDETRERAIACVNALDGLDPEIVKEFTLWYSELYEEYVEGYPRGERRKGGEIANPIDLWEEEGETQS